MNIHALFVVCILGMQSVRGIKLTSEENKNEDGVPVYRSWLVESEERAFKKQAGVYQQLGLQTPPAKPTLFLDLDGTLIFRKDYQEKAVKGNTHLRPYLEDFLKECSKWFELVLYTAATSERVQGAVEEIKELVENPDIFAAEFYKDDAIWIFPSVGQPSSNLFKDINERGRTNELCILIDDSQDIVNELPGQGVKAVPYSGVEDRVEDKDNYLDTFLLQLTLLAGWLKDNKDVKQFIKDGVITDAVVDRNVVFIPVPDKDKDIIK